MGSLIKIIGQLTYLGARIAGAYIIHTGKLAIQRLAVKRIASASTATAAAAANKTGSMSVEEACKILDVELKTPPREMIERYKRHFEANDGGSLYILSKFVRARQRLEQHFGKSLEDLEAKK